MSLSDHLSFLRRGGGMTTASLPTKEARKAARRSRKQAEAEARARFFDAAHRHSPLLAVESEHGAFVVSTTDRAIGRRLFLKGHYAARELPRALDVLASLGYPDPRSGWLLDIGANIGTVCISAVRKTGFKGALAFEPHPDNARLLRINVLYNELESSIRVFPVALSDRDHTTELYVADPENSGAHVVAPADAAIPLESGIAIEARSLDSLVSEGALSLESVTLAWLDVQGHEPFVLAGARSLVAAAVPVVVEFYPTALRDLEGFALMVSIVRQYAGFVNLRSAETPGSAPTVLPWESLEELGEELGSRFTDLLLIPRPTARQTGMESNEDLR